MFQIQNGNKGSLIIEVMFVVSVIAVTIGGFLGLAAFVLEGLAIEKEATRARFLAQELLEGVRAYRNEVPWDQNDPFDEYDGLSFVPLNTPYYLELSQDIPVKLKLLAGKDSVDIYMRDVAFSQVMRDGTDSIVLAGGTADPNTKKVKATVSWERKGTSRLVEVETYLTNWND